MDEAPSFKLSGAYRPPAVLGVLRAVDLAALRTLAGAALAGPIG